MKKAEHEVVEVLIAAACAVRSGADTCVEIDAWANGAVVAIDGRTSRRSRKPNGSWGQRATAMKSNGKTAIPVRLATLALEGSGDQTIPQHGRAENSLPRRMDVAFGDDQRRVLTERTAHDLACYAKSS